MCLSTAHTLSCLCVRRDLVDEEVAANRGPKENSPPSAVAVQHSERGKNFFNFAQALPSFLKLTKKQMKYCQQFPPIMVWQSFAYPSNRWHPRIRVENANFNPLHIPPARRLVDRRFEAELVGKVCALLQNPSSDSGRVDRVFGVKLSELHVR